METIYKIGLCLHIVSGFLALLSGCISMLSKKGGRLHRLSGKIFFFSMLGVCVTSVFISIIKHNTFLLVIGIFSFYLNYFGYMAIKNKSLRPKPMDWIVVAITGINTAFMIGSKNPVLMVFGGLCVYALIQNVRTAIHILQNKELPKLLWLRRHIGMMVGAFIATATAFLVVNSASFAALQMPVWFWWLLPTFVLLPVLIYYSKAYTGNKAISGKTAA